MSAITIRRARPDDAAEGLRLIEELFVAPGARPPAYSVDAAREAFERAVAGDRSDILLAVHGSRAVGLATVYVDLLSIRFGLRCWLEDLAVQPSYRGRGVGRLLLDAAADWARTCGCSHLELNSGNGRADAHRFYLTSGMKQDSLSFSMPLHQ